MNSTKKNIQKTSGIHRLGKFYKPGQSACVVLTEIMKNMISVWNYQ